MITFIFCSVIVGTLIALAIKYNASRQQCLQVMHNLTTANPENEDKPVEETSSSHFSLALAQVCYITLVACLPISFDQRVVLAVIGVGIIYLVFQRVNSNPRSNGKKDDVRVVYELPLVMEKLVMAVQAGHDILPALKTVIDNSEKKTTESLVLKVLEDVVIAVEGGLTLQASLRMVAKNATSTPLRHALLHIAVSHEQGGGLVFALSELADATQIYYQEMVEEQIAILPVKATLPLVIVFGGVLTILLTSPIIQVLQTVVKHGGNG